jgi:hypothetical protein
MIDFDTGHCPENTTCPSQFHLNKKQVFWLRFSSSDNIQYEQWSKGLRGLKISQHASPPSKRLDSHPDGPSNTGPTNNASLEAFQNSKQRLVLATVAQVWKCGLESILALPQLVVCGDQSAGKSSVLQALTDIPFLRKDELCTCYATEIIMHCSTIDSLTIEVISG